MNNEHMPNLSIVAANEEVQILQEKLRILGYYAGNITGSFGSTTEEAVLNFQRDNNLEVTGVVDDKTWELLYRLTESPFPRRRANLPTLRLGDSGEYVELLQRQLKQLLYYDGPITKIFDQATYNAVKQFQLINKLTANGVVDMDTWSGLMYLYAPLSNCLGEGPGVEPEEGDYYTVVAGDTLWGIAKKLGLSVDELKSLNNLTSDTLQIGQKLKTKETTTPPTGEYDYYTVQSGDTLWAIANRFGISVDELKKINNLTGNNLSIGQQLLIPKTTGGPSPEPGNNYIDYTVQKGDTLWAIANRYKIPIAEIRRINNLTSDSLSIGQILHIPTTGGSGYLEYVVKKGDTLWSIANRYNMTVTRLRQINNLTSDSLSIGQILQIEV